MRRQTVAQSWIVGVCGLGLLGAVAYGDPAVPLPGVETMPVVALPADLAAESAGTEIPLRVAQADPAPMMPRGGKMQLQAEDPTTGQTINIDISSEALNYNSETGVYTVTGDVYIIIPERKLEILADQVTFNPKTSNMVALGNVFVIYDNRVVGSEQVQFDIDQNTSYYLKPRTLTDYLRIRAEQGLQAQAYTILKNGRLIVDDEVVQEISKTYSRRGMRIGTGALFSNYSANRRRQLIQAGSQQDDYLNGERIGYDLGEASLEGEPTLQPKPARKVISPRDVAAADFSKVDTLYHVKVKTVNIHRKADGFDEIVFKQARLRYRNVPLLYAPFVEVGYQEEDAFLTYLGPDVGYNMDYGGVYAGPGWDFRLFDGWVRLSPIVTYGGGRRLRISNDEPAQVDTQFGVGVLTNFRSENNQTQFGYSTTIRDPILLMEQELFNREQTKLRVGVNQYYNNGFYESERPRFISEVFDRQSFHPFQNWLLQTYVSAGVAKDNFFPTRQRRFFVTPKSGDPVTTFRAQLQAQLKTEEPLLRIGRYGGVGALAQGRVGLYGTGDVYTILQGGPYLNFVLGPTFHQVRYFYSQTVGETPFVFDTFYRGRNNVQTINSIDLGQHLTVGALHSLNLNQDNARNDLLVDQKLFVSIGSRSLRFSMAYDTIQRRSFFGLTLNPAGGQVVLDFDNLNLYQPDYNPAVHRPVMPPLPAQNPPAPQS